MHDVDLVPPPPIQPPAPLGFIGLGMMGASMAANLHRAGFVLRVHTRSRHRAAPLEAAGAAWAATPLDAGRGAACVAICVPDTSDVEAVLFGAGGVAAGLAEGAVVLDFSTIDAEATRGFARRLLAERGAFLLDSPVSGGPQGARDATLTCMVGGDGRAFEAALPVLRAVGRTITHLGPSGAGQVCKAANQLILAATMQAVAEALALGRAAGLDPGTMRAALLGGSARSVVLEKHALRMIEGDLTPAFRAELLRKDLRLAAAALRAHGVFAPGTAVVGQMLEALVGAGRGKQDASALGALVAELSGQGEAKPAPRS